VGFSLDETLVLQATESVEEGSPIVCGETNAWQRSPGELPSDCGQRHPPTLWTSGH
jgi:hypothetical protein